MRVPQLNTQQAHDLRCPIERLGGMHELSIANALIRLADEYRPPGCQVDALCVRAGPLRAIDPGAMQWAWQAARRGTQYADAALTLEMLPWRLHCADCGRQWNAPAMIDACDCGSSAVAIDGGDELLLVSLEVRDEP